MSNSIALAKVYTTILDELYAAGSKTAILDNNALTRFTAIAEEVLIPKISLQGLGAYSKSSGFANGDVTFAWETHKMTQDRGRSFQVDAVDDMETINQAFSYVASQFMRTKVIPEIDAYRIATMAGKAGNTATPATPTKTTIAQLIGTAKAVMSDAEVPLEQRVLFITPEMNNLLSQSDMYVRNVAGVNGAIATITTYDGMQVIEVPQSRMYTVITQYDGVTGGQEAGSYIKDAGTGKDINFMIVHTPSVLGVTKRMVPRIFSPDINQSADAYKFQLRIVHDIFVPDNKTAGIYLHHKA